VKAEFAYKVYNQLRATFLETLSSVPAHGRLDDINSLKKNYQATIISASMIILSNVIAHITLSMTDSLNSTLT